MRKKLLEGIIKPKGTRAAKEIEASKKNRETISRLANQKRIAKSGQSAVLPAAKASVKKAVKGSNKETGSKRIVGTNQIGKKPVKEMTKLEKQDYDFEGFNKGLKRSLIDKARKGESAVYQGTDYSFMLSELRGIKPRGEKKALKERQKANVEEVKKRQAGTVNKREGGKINTSKRYRMKPRNKETMSPTDAMRAKLKGRVSTGTSKSSPAAPSLTTPKETSPKKTFTKKKEFMYGDKLPETKPKQTFGQAFAAARKAGKKEFMYNGKPYHTRTKEEEAKRKKSGTVNKRAGGKVSKPKGCGAATRGYGKAMKGNK